MRNPLNIPEVTVETETVRIVREAADMSLKIGFPVRLIGRPGTGKTCAMWHVAQEMEDIYCEVTAGCKNVKGMYEMLLRAIDCPSGRNHVSDIADLVFLKYSPDTVLFRGEWVEKRYRVFVDEIQTMEAPALRELLRVQERCQIGLILAGNEERLAGGTKDTATLEQIESRILPPRRLPGPSKQDCELIGTSFGVEEMPAYKALAEFGMSTNFRALVQMLTVAKHLTAGTTGIRLQHIEAAMRFMGKPELLKHMRKEVA